MVTGYLCWKRFFPPASYQLTRNRNVYLPELNQRGLGDWLEWIINHMQALTHLVTPMPCMLCSMPISFHVALRKKMKIQNYFPTLLCTVLCAKLDSIKESKSTTPKKMLWYGQSITACLLYQQSMRLLTLCVIFTFLCLRSSLRPNMSVLHAYPEACLFSSQLFLDQWIGLICTTFPLTPQ